jgi:hypothetical protein
LLLALGARLAVGEDRDRDGIDDELERSSFGTHPGSPDTDGDGLLDGWEVYGRERGGYLEPLAAYGADPLQKDVFVELDWMASADGSSERESEKALIVYQAALDVMRVFRDSGTGIRIHIDLGPDILSLVPLSELEPEETFHASLLRFRVDPDTVKVLPHQDQFPARPRFGSESTLRSLYEIYYSPRIFRPSRRNVFYYVVFAEQRLPAAEDRAQGEYAPYHPFVDAFDDDLARRDGLRTPGVHAGAFFQRPVRSFIDPRDRRYFYSVNLLHELGHAFGLGHGGALSGGRWDTVNFKLNYPSIMNYRYQYWGVDSDGGARIMDFSHGALQPLREVELFEPSGLGARLAPHVLENLRLTVGVTHLAATPYPSNLDWNQDGQVTGVFVRRDVNQDGLIDAVAYSDHDDWGKFLRDGFDGIGRRAYHGCGELCALGDDIERLQGDFNGDGFADLFVRSGDRVAWALARGDGTLAIEPTTVSESFLRGAPISLEGKFLAGDFLGSGRDSLFWHRGSSAAVVDRHGAEPHLMAVTPSAQVPGLDAGIEAWSLRPTDRFFAFRAAGARTGVAVTDGRAAAVLVVTGALDDPGAPPALATAWHSGETVRSWTGGGPLVLHAGRRSRSILLSGPGVLAELTWGGDSVPFAARLERLDADRVIPAPGAEGGGWALSSLDRFQTADLDGDRLDEILVSGSRRLGVIGRHEDRPALLWSAREAIGAYELTDEGNRVYPGQLVPGGGEELLLVSGRSWLALGWSATGGALEILALDEGTVRGEGGLEWPIERDQELRLGRFLPGEAAVLLARAGSRLLLARFEGQAAAGEEGEAGEENGAGGAGEAGEAGPGFRPLLVLDVVAGGWALNDRDAFLPLQLDGTAELEVLAWRGPLHGVIRLAAAAEAVSSPFLATLETEPFGFLPVAGFRRADVNLDADVDLSDASRLLNYLFLGGDSLGCRDAADANDNGDLNISDAVYTLAFLFLRGEPPPYPGPFERGVDPTFDALDCQAP